jgi:Bacterial Ig domain/IPT/TIG domain
MMQTSSFSHPTRADRLSTAGRWLQALRSGRRWLAPLLALAALLGGVDAGAVPLTWTVNGTTVSGITVTGTFVYDADSGATSQVNLRASNGKTFTSIDNVAPSIYGPRFFVANESPVVAGVSWAVLIQTSESVSPYNTVAKTNRGGTLTLRPGYQQGAFLVCQANPCTTTNYTGLAAGDLEWATGGTAVAVSPYPFVETVTPTLVRTQGGSTVTITGVNFTGTTDVKFGNVSAGSGNFTVVNDTTITATVPAQANGANGKVIVFNAAGSIPNTELATSPSVIYYAPYAEQVRILTGASTTASVTNATGALVDTPVKGIYLFVSTQATSEKTQPPNNSTYRWALSASSAGPINANANGPGASGNTLGGYTRIRSGVFTNLNAISYTPVAADLGQYLRYCVTPAAANGFVGVETCSSSIPVGPVPGVCGSAANVVSATAPTANLCTATGAAPTVTGSNRAWRWSCTGVNTGADASCTAPFPSQTISNFSASPGSINIGGTSTLSATKGAGSAAVVFSSNTTGVCTVSGSTVTAVAAGICTVAANQAADDNYNAATEVATNITVDKSAQTITSLAANPASVNVGGTSTLSATKGAGSADVVFSSKTPAVCTVSGSTVTAVAAGICTVAANQAADDNYNAATEVTSNITVGRAAQTITGLSANPASINVSGTSTLSATKGAGSAAAVFSSKTQAVCTVSGSTVTALTAGTCTVAANQAADDNYNAATEVTTTIEVGKAAQSISNFMVNPTSINVGDTGTLSAISGAGTAALVFSSRTTGICTVSGTTVTAVAEGNCTLAADQAADERYAAAPSAVLNLAVGADKTPPARPNPPTVVQNPDATITVSGLAEANALVTVKLPDGSTAQVRADASGRYTLRSAKAQPSGTVEVTATDASGNVSTVSEATAYVNQIVQATKAQLSGFMSSRQRQLLAHQPSLLRLLQAARSDRDASTGAARGEATWRQDRPLVPAVGAHLDIQGVASQARVGFQTHTQSRDASPEAGALLTSLFGAQRVTAAIDAAVPVPLNTGHAGATTLVASLSGIELLGLNQRGERQFMTDSPAQVNVGLEHLFASGDSLSIKAAHLGASNQLTAQSNPDAPVWLNLEAAWGQAGQADMTYAHGAVGAHTWMGPKTILGAMLQFDHAKEVGGVSHTGGTGFLIGPYFATQLPGQALFLEGALLAGASNNTISPSGTYTDRFRTQRMLATAKLSGQWQVPGATLTPWVGMQTLSDKSSTYTDSLGNVVSGMTQRSGQLKLGLDAAVPLTVSQGSMALLAGVSGGHVWETQRTSTSANGTLLRMDLGLEGAIKMGLSWRSNLFYGGLLGGGYQYFGFSLSFQVPF